MKNSISEVVPNYLQKNLILYYSFYDCMILSKPAGVTDTSSNKHNGQEKDLKIAEQGCQTRPDIENRSVPEGKIKGEEETACQDRQNL